MWLVAKEHWHAQAGTETAISPFVRDALEIELRLPKGVNLTNELIRYQLCCRRIQNAVVQGSISSLDKKEFAAEPFLADLRKLATMEYHGLKSGRLAACFFPPDYVPKAIETMRSSSPGRGASATAGFTASFDQRLEFFEKAARESAGVIESFDFLDELFSLPHYEKQERSPDHRTRQQDEASLDGSLLDCLNQAISSGGSINFSNRPHPEITEALNASVYADDGGQPAEVRVIYMDGTEAAPFPVRCLKKMETADFPEDSVHLRAALISMRHLEMDGRVDFAWFRNRQVSAGGSFAEVDAFCTRQTLELLRSMPRDRAVTLEMYQTGLETAVIGFYRGLTLWLQQREKGSPPFRVVPMYYGRTEGYQEGMPWA